MSSPSKRKEIDFMKLLMNDYKVDMINDNMQEFYVHFKGPANSLYARGIWKVRVELPDGYPYSSPSIGFVNKIYHPNIDDESGTVCVDVLNQNWSPMFDLINVFDSFLPDLLNSPNPLDPLNRDAAALLLRDRSAYEEKVKEYCLRYAKPEDIGVIQDENSSDEEASADEKNSEDEVVAAGPSDP